MSLRHSAARSQRTARAKDEGGNASIANGAGRQQAAIVRCGDRALLARSVIVMRAPAFVLTQQFAPGRNAEGAFGQLISRIASGKDFALRHRRHEAPRFSNRRRLDPRVARRWRHGSPTFGVALRSSVVAPEGLAARPAPGQCVWARTLRNTTLASTITPASASAPLSTCKAPTLRASRRALRSYAAWAASRCVRTGERTSRRAS
jgi:hypothetical protein